MDRFHAMQVFIKVAEAESFAEAARVLNMNPTGVTRAVAFLETAIAARLFTRTTRVVKLTEIGLRYLDDCRRILAEVAEADAAATGSYSKPSGTLTVTASVLFGQIYVQPILAEFLDANPQVTGRAMFLDRITNIVDEGIDVAVRIGHLSDSSLSAARVGTVRRVICGSPAYFEEHEIPASPADLLKHRLIAATSAWASLEWKFGVQEKTAVQVQPALLCNTYQTAIDTARQGWGLTRVLSYQVGSALMSGELRTVLTEYEEDPLPVHVVHPEGRRASAKVRAFVDLAVARLRANRVIN
ncbi:MAG: LysR family transcriptional regulator [Caulobacteraceae bacterium]